MIRRLIIAILDRHDPGLSAPVPRPAPERHRVLDLEACGAKVRYSSRGYDEATAKAARRRADERERITRQVAAGKVHTEAQIRRVK